MKTSRTVYCSGALGKQQMQSVSLPKAVKVVLIVRLEGVTKQDGDVELCEVNVKVAQLCPTLCDPMDLVHGILRPQSWKWVAFPFSRGSSQRRDQTQVSHLAGHSLIDEPHGKPKGS